MGLQQAYHWAALAQRGGADCCLCGSAPHAHNRLFLLSLRQLNAIPAGWNAAFKASPEAGVCARFSALIMQHWARQPGLYSKGTARKPCALRQSV